ncbi:MAG: hypothetical protein ACFFB0_11565 [Promethearchaeota archaeon]
MPNSDSDKLLLELVACDRCKNPFMMQKGEKLKKQQNNEEIICDNCIKLEERKKRLELGVLDSVIESQKKIEASIKEVKNKIDHSKAVFNKTKYLKMIKKKSQSLIKSIDLLQKIDETNDEKYFEEYKKLFEKMKEEDS